MPPPISRVPAQDACFAGVDWGTSTMRLWLFDSNGQVQAERRSADGMARCQGAAAFQDALDRHLAALAVPAAVPVVACGMVGARQGWVEARYVDTGTPLVEIPRLATRAPHPTREVLILPGVAQRTDGSPDVIRGEETLILGLAGQTAALVVQPGTHSKWIETDGHSIVRFSTYMTGELFELLCHHSTLALLMPKNAHFAPDSPAFPAALARALADPALALEALFALRAGGLLGLTCAQTACATLSGLLIGAEVGLVRRRYDGTPVHLLASGVAASHYAMALTQAAMPFVINDAEAACRRGLLIAARTLGWLT